MAKVIYIHGFEGSLNGTKGSWLQERCATIGPQMSCASFDKLPEHLNPEDTQQLLPYIKKQVVPSANEVIQQIDFYALQPKVVIASSFGAAVWLHIVQSYPLRYPTILLAPACIALGNGEGFPHDMETIIIHGEHDEIIPPQHAIELHRKSGPKSQLLWVNDGHQLHSLTTTSDALQNALSRFL